MTTNEWRIVLEGCDASFRVAVEWDAPQLAERCSDCLSVGIHRPLPAPAWRAELGPTQHRLETCPPGESGVSTSLYSQWTKNVKGDDGVPPSQALGGERIQRYTVSKTLVCVSVAAVFAVSLFAGMATAKVESMPTENVDDDARTVAKWSVLVYLVADNDLDSLTEEDFQELKDGGSSDSVNVLILVDRLYEPAYIYCIEDNDLVELESLGEVNMGDPDTLTGFVEYSDTNYPAEHILLYFWDHGTPTGGVGVDTTMEGSEPGSDWDWLTHHEVTSALDDYHIDVIACDECSIGQMETLYEYAVNGLSVDYMVASENYIGWRGFSYDKIHQRLVLNPEMDALELSKVIVEEFTNLFSVAPFKSEIVTTQSIFNMSKIIPLGDAVSAMANTLAQDIDSYRSVIGAAMRDSIMPWGARGESWIDMPNFVENIAENAKTDGDVAASCAAVMDAYAEAMLGMGITKNSEKYGYQGMGILFPASHNSYSVAYADSEWGGFNIYITYEFPNMGWWSFLETYWGLA